MKFNLINLEINKLEINAHHNINGIFKKPTVIKCVLILIIFDKAEYFKTILMMLWDYMQSLF